MEVIKRRSSSLIDFVDRYRTVAELPQPRLESIRAQELIEGVVRLLAPQIPPDTLPTCTSVGDTTLQGDRQLLEQALINLLRNAIEALAGSVDARIATTCSRRDEHTELAVSDNGSGICDEIRDRIFLPFFTTKPADRELV